MKSLITFFAFYYGSAVVVGVSIVLHKLITGAL